MLGQAAVKNKKKKLESVRQISKLNTKGKTNNNKIVFSSFRKGNVVGEHDVIFSTLGERVILRHVATDRMIFARGAVSAAIWGVGKGPGEYDMTDVLGL